MQNTHARTPSKQKKLSEKKRFLKRLIASILPFTVEMPFDSTKYRYKDGRNVDKSKGGRKHTTDLRGFYTYTMTREVRDYRHGGMKEVSFKYTFKKPQIKGKLIIMSDGLKWRIS